MTRISKSQDSGPGVKGLAIALRSTGQVSYKFGNTCLQSGKARKKINSVSDNVQTKYYLSAMK